MPLTKVALIAPNSLGAASLSANAITSDKTNFNNLNVTGTLTAVNLTVNTLTVTTGLTASNIFPAKPEGKFIGFNLIFR